ncbi:Nucleotidylyl transferase [Testicularia cyperi]|uniref:Nucleotidylyl transferase n=1 Tax=Testicularia cyperi TaxID=1882483 RepID=A0A317XSL8_9BASI|nr:Nucleotidylyl transferase [Testicularia cyperi]
MSRQVPTAPMPRMTDSQAGPGGPSSLKFAALSVQSYQLDSPPFTGAAVGGGGPLDEAGRHTLHQQHTRADGMVSMAPTSTAAPSSASSAAATPSSTVVSPPVSQDSTYVRQDGAPLASSRRSPLVKGTVRNGAADDDEQQRRSASPTRSTRTHGEADSVLAKTPTAEEAPSNGRLATHGESIAQLDRDVPHWHLDGEQLSRENSSNSLKTLSPDKPIVGLTSIRDSQSNGEVRAISPNAASSSRAALGGRSTFSPSRSSSTGQVRRPGTSPFAEGSDDRPAYSQFSEELDAQEDAGSSVSAADKDDEVDGVESFSFGNTDASRAGRVPRQGQTKEEYRFPRHRLPTKMRDESRIPLVIVACGSFSPPTYLHLRIFEMAKDQVNESGKYELMAGYYSPVSDYYKKEGLAKATHRVRMCELAVEKTSTWLMVDAWESLQDEYQRTAVVLDHFDEEINRGPDGGVQLSDGTRRRVKIMLLAGGDLIQSMGEPGVWATADLHHILGRYGCLIVERTGADVWSFLLSHDLLWKYRRNLKIVKQTIYNDISSSKVRLFVRRGQSIKYLLPNSVIQYIERAGLYRLPPDEDAKSETEDTNW